MEMCTIIDIDTHLRVTYRHDEFHWLSVNPLILLMKWQAQTYLKDN